MYSVCGQYDFTFVKTSNGRLDVEMFYFCIYIILNSTTHLQLIVLIVILIVSLYNWPPHPPPPNGKANTTYEVLLFV